MQAGARIEWRSEEAPRMAPYGKGENRRAVRESPWGTVVRLEYRMLRMSRNSTVFVRSYSRTGKE